MSLLFLSLCTEDVGGAGRAGLGETKRD